MPKTYFICFAACLSLALATLFPPPAYSNEDDDQSALEYSFVVPRVGEKSTDLFLNDNRIYDIYTTRVNPKSGDSYTALQNHRGRIVKRFSSNDSVEVEASGRYRGRAYILVTRRYSCGKKTCRQTRLYNESGRSVAFVRPSKVFAPNDTLDTLITRNGELMLLTTRGVIVYDAKGNQLSKTPISETLQHGAVRNNPDGGTMAIAVCEQNEVWVSDLAGWKRSGLRLSSRGDRKNIFGCWPDPGGHYFGVVYRYINEYNKGLYVIDYCPAEGTIHAGRLFNSSIRNIGFDPDVYANEDKITVSAKNSTQNNVVHFVFPAADISSMSLSPPEHVRGFEREKNLDIMVGMGAARLSWITQSRVKAGSDTIMRVKYDISDSTFLRTSFEGRYGDTHLAITYMQNWAEDKIADGDRLTKQASSLLFGSVDFHGLISSSSSLRLLLDKSDIKGVAVIDGHSTVDPLMFNTGYTRFAIMVMRERGYFGGMDYVNYQKPSAIGFEKGRRVHAYYNNDLEIHKIGLIGGYDTLSYARRYETNYRTFYLDFNGGLGLGWLALDKDFEKRVEAELNGKIRHPLFFEANLAAEAGYVIQARSRILKGAGFQLKGGYRGQGIYMTAIKKKNPKYNDIIVDWDKYDILHGPFVEASVIF